MLLFIACCRPDRGAPSGFPSENRSQNDAKLAYQLELKKQVSCILLFSSPFLLPFESFLVIKMLIHTPPDWGKQTEEGTRTHWEWEVEVCQDIRGIILLNNVIVFLRYNEGMKPSWTEKFVIMTPLAKGVGVLPWGTMKATLSVSTTLTFDLHPDQLYWLMYHTCTVD